MKKFFVSFSLLIITTSLFCQNGLYFSVGYLFDTYLYIDPLVKGINDFNAVKLNQGMLVEKEMKTPGIFTGLVIGMKSNINFSNINFDIIHSRFRASAKGTDSLFNSYYEKINVGIVGMTINYSLNLINTDYFRMGPGLGLQLVQCRMYVRNDISYGTSAYEKPVNNFLMSGDIRFPISIGGEKFMFDIVPYYVYPFWKPNSTVFYQEMNYSMSEIYESQNPIKFNTQRWGISFTLNFKLNIED
ncbi:MAG TPA: hypothetical protein PKN32_11710 [Bacteroidales bacterium]|nr:hypothetical protein [Bacteroidales bacterium]